MKKRIHTIEMDRELFEANSHLIKDDVVFIKPTQDKVVIELWMSFKEAFKARIELFYYNLLMPRKIKMRRGITTK